MNEERLTYRAAGVDIEAGEQFVERIKAAVASTRTEGVLGELGGFGGCFAVPGGYGSPVLVAGADGVGTKLKIAFQMDKHDTVGIDAVAMNVNDIVTQGARPLFVLDYLATGKLRPGVLAAVVEGVAEGCRQAGCVLLGGETAEMPGFYAKGEYDIACFAVGILERDQAITGEQIQAGDQLLGLPSNGLHSNGFSLVRKALLERGKMPLDGEVEELACSLGEELLRPTRVYVADVLNLMEAVPVLGLAHITGGGFAGNVPRMLPEGLGAIIRPSKWPIPPVFDLVQRVGRVEREEMFRTFNMGMGMVAAVRPDDVQKAIETLSEIQVIGEIVSGESCEIGP